MKIGFVLTAHFPDDERVWYQQAKALIERGYDVSIVSSKIEQNNYSNVFCFNDLGLSKTNVIQRIKNILLDIQPEIIICDNPIAVIAAKKYTTSKKAKTTLIYDVTEWYPSKINLLNLNFLKKVIKFFTLTFLSFYAGCIVDKFIFGEYYKSRFFRFLFPCKKFIFLSYFANIEFLKQYPIRDISKKCELFYAGNLTKANGYDNILKVAEKCAEKMPNTMFVLKVIDTQDFDISKFENSKKLEFQFINKLPFLDFCKEIGQSDLFLDLREIDFIKNHSLPIKIFYYLAAGRPVIYSDVKAIRKFFSKNEINNFGYLVNPKNIENIVKLIENYVNNPDYYNKCCNFSYEIAKNKYQWKHIEQIFIDFIEDK
ncbi:MAG: glycosyltransferase [Bacteroidetes bacterium]|nr:glycosyltransferase [Bacteroidota bacterium]MCL1969179.1 glycosyltransferase [Bacteroidota bacterium]